MTATASAGIRKSMVSSSWGERFDDQGGPLAPADAGAAEAVSAGLAPQSVEQMQRDARAARSERMAQGHRAPVDIGALPVESELVLHGEVLGGERFVDLDQVHQVE